MYMYVQSQSAPGNNYLLFTYFKVKTHQDDICCGPGVKQPAQWQAAVGATLIHVAAWLCLATLT